MPNDLNDDLKKIRADIAELRGDIGSLGTTLRDLGAGKARRARERVQEAGEHAEDQLRAARDGFEREIENHPYVSVLASLGVGFLAGLLLDRRR